jgi:hypothetical protein
MNSSYTYSKHGLLNKIVKKSKNMFILNIALNNFLNSIYENLFDGYFPFMLQGTQTISFTMLGPLSTL